MALTKMYITLFAALTSLNAVYGQLSSCPQPAFDYLAPHILPGFSLTKLADGLKHPRQVVVDQAKNLVISSLGDGIVGMKVAYDGAGCPSVTEKKVLVADDGRNFTHSVVLSENGKTLFASTPDYAYAFEYDAGSLSINGEPKTIVKGMANSPKSMSITRAMAVPKEFPHLLMVFRGEDNDTDYRSAEVSGGLGEIKLFDWTTAPADGYDFTGAGEVFAMGVRDTLEFTQDCDGIFWNVDNGADEIERNGVPIGQPGSLNPADELNRLGKVCPGQKPVNTGFPYCHPVWDPASIPSNALNLQIGQTFSTFNGTSDATCNADTVAPRLSILPHSAPLGLRFYEPARAALGEYLRGFAFVSYHGPTGHKLVLAPFNHGDAAAPPSSPQGAVDFIWTDKSVNLTNCVSEAVKGPSATKCIAPVGLAYDEEGTLFWTSDQTGEVFAVTKDKGMKY